jgi:hypothetical protein
MFEDNKINKTALHSLKKRYFGYNNYHIGKDMGGYSQNFLGQILKIFAILGLNIYYRPKVFFKANISKV